MLNAIAFQAGGAPLGQPLLAAADGRYVHVLGRSGAIFSWWQGDADQNEDAATPPQSIFGAGGDR